MSFWTRVKGLFGGDKSPASSAGGLLSGVLMSGVQAPRRGTKELIQAHKRIPFLRSAVGRISHDVAAVPLRLYRSRRGRGSKHFGLGQVRKAALLDATHAGEMQEVPTHPFLDLMTFMNPALGCMPTRQLTQVYLELVGEAFWVFEFNGMAQPLEAWPVPPHWILETPRAQQPFYRASYAGWQKLFPENAVLHLREPDPENPYGRGAGRGTSLGDELDIDENATRHVKNWFYNGTLPAAIVGLEGVNDDGAKRFKTQLRQDHRGTDKAHDVYVTGAKVSVSQLSDTFKDQELVALRAATRDILIQSFNIPPEVMGIIENSNRATIDASYFLYATGVLCPRLDFMVSALQPLLEQFDDSLVLDYVSPVPEDREYKKQLFLGLPSNFTVDEHRALACMPPLPDNAGTELYSPMGPTESLMQPPPPEPKWVGELRRLLPRRKGPADGGLGRGDIESVLEALLPERLADEVGPTYSELVRRWGQRTLDELGLDANFNMRNPLVREQLEKFSTTKIKGLVDETTRARLRKELTEGAYAGEGIDQLALRITEVFDVADKVRARTIARTEVVGGSNFASVQAFMQSGVVAQKEWLATQDSRTREAHGELDGQKVRVDGAFHIRGYSANYPGGFGVPEMDIQCRCSALPVVDEDKSGTTWIRKDATKEERVLVWKRFDRRAIAWEKALASSLRRGFHHQRADVLDALYSLKR